MNAFGGEDRFWMGPEGGQFSIFFAKGAKFELERLVHARRRSTRMPFKVVQPVARPAQFRHEFAADQLLRHRASTCRPTARCACSRRPPPGSSWASKPRPGVRLVAYESDNRITNAGKKAWKKDTGLLSIWILGMFNPSPATTIVVPIKPGPGGRARREGDLGLLRRRPARAAGGEGRRGLLQRRRQVSAARSASARSAAKPILGSYDAESNVLTIVQFTLARRRRPTT